MDESWTVRRVMSAPAVTATPHTGAGELARLLREHGVSGVPVVGEDGRPLGVVSEADLPPAKEPSTAATAGELMSAPAITVSPEAWLSEAAGLMRERGVRRLVTVGRDGRVAGVVTRTDLLKVYLRDDAAIEREVGAIARDVLWLPDDSLSVRVHDGVVTLEGRLGRRSDADLVVALVRRVPGVADAHAAIMFDEDDTRLPEPAARQAG
jgi:CBS domain-containing protein